MSATPSPASSESTTGACPTWRSPPPAPPDRFSSPTLDGERKPNRPGAHGILAGLTSGTSREDIARAAFEGVILGLVSGERHLNSAGVATGGRLVDTGGGARSGAYTQLLADLTGRPPVDADTIRGGAGHTCG